MPGIFRFIYIFSLLLACTACQKETPYASKTTLRISSDSDPQTLDPRQARDLQTSTLIHMLYEGLMRAGKEGQPQFALAKSVHLSNDQRTYTFTLRDSQWSNGKPVTAYDFEQTWKSILSPRFPAPNAYQLYIIKGARAAKEGLDPLDQVGIHALDPFTLQVELTTPTPYFLNLLTTYFFYPVSPEMREKGLLPEKLTKENLITNGPFQLEEWRRNNELIVVKNPHYWDAENVYLDQIAVIVLDNSTALAMFERQELDWTGSPLSTIPIDALATLKHQGSLSVTPGAGTYFLRYNTLELPFNDSKLRKAFTLAINRQELVEHTLQGNQIPAMGLLPPSFVSQHEPLFKDHDEALAQKYFQEALTEQYMTKSDLPTVKLCYANNERAHKIAQVLQQQWKRVLGIEVDLQSCETKVVLERLKSGYYQIAIGSWFADFADPISFLEVFKFKNNGTNNTRWENRHYTELLERSAHVTPPTSREALLKQAENMLIEAMPIAPLFYSSYNYLKCPHLQDAYFSELGYIDFTHAYFEP